MRLVVSGKIWIKEMKYPRMASVPFRSLTLFPQRFGRAKSEKVAATVPEYCISRIYFLPQ